MKLNLLIVITFFFTTVCNAQKDSTKNKRPLPIGETWESDYYIDPRVYEPAIIEKYYVFTFENGKQKKQFLMTALGKNLYIESSGADCMFKNSDTIRVANRVFVAMPEVKQTNEIQFFRW